MLNEIKMLLGITDTDRDSLILLIISATTARLKTLIRGIDPPESLDYIIRDVSIMRFNRIGSEGMKSHGVEGESIAFSDNDFDSFADDIAAFLAAQNKTPKGRLRFL